MAFIQNGTDLLLYVASGSAFKSLAHTTNFSVNYSTAMRKVANKTTGKLAAYLPGEQDVKISAEGMVCYTSEYNEAKLGQLWQDRQKVWLVIASRNSASIDVPLNTTGYNYGSGSFYIDKLDFTAPYENNVTFNAGFSLGEDGYTYYVATGSSYIGT